MKTALPSIAEGVAVLGQQAKCQQGQGAGAPAESLFRARMEQIDLEQQPMGELIAFKAALGGLRVRAAPLRQGTVVIFTGLWQDRPKGYGAKTKPARRGSTKRPKKKIGKQGGGAQEHSELCL